MKKILIVDDEPHIAWVIKQFLERAGWKVFTALNGQLAVAVIIRDQPDVVVADVSMPKMSGIDLCRHIQNTMPDYRPLLMLLISRKDREIRSRLAQQEPIEIMVKPVSMRRLLARINDFSAQGASCS